MSDVTNDESQKKQSGWVVVAWLIIGVFILVLLPERNEKFNKDKEIAGPQISRCLDGSNNLSGKEFEMACEGRSLSAYVYPIDCNGSSIKCNLSLVHPKDPKFKSDLKFKANLKEKIPSSTEKLVIQAVIVDRGAFGKVEVDISSQKSVGLSATEIHSISEWSKPKPSPEFSAKMWLEEREAENQRMISYAEKNHDELSRRARKFVINEGAVRNMAEWRYYMPEGKIVSCLRGFEGDAFIYKCTSN